MAEERLGASFAIDVTNLKAGLNMANKMIRESESEFKAAAAGMDDWSASEDGLNAKIKSLNNITDLQRKKVDALTAQYEQLIADGLDPASSQAVELRTKINNETSALKRNESELKKQTDALNNLGKETKEASQETDKLSKAFDGLKKVGGTAVKAVAGIGAACVGAVAGFLALGESTKETQVQMAKLNTAFETAGMSGDAAQTAMYDLFGVLGDADRATEASVLLAKMSKDEDDLQANTRILSGVFAEFGDSIPTEGLAEGMQATAKMGEVQGVLADALEWQGVNLEEYNAKLATMSSEEERAAYIQSTLTDLYGESADAYRENNKALIESNEAQLQLQQVLAEIGAVAMPIMTELKTMVTELLHAIKPFIQLIGEGLTDAFDGTAGAGEKLAEGLGGILTTLLDKIVGVAPLIIDTVVAIIPSLLEKIMELSPKIIDAIVGIIPQLVTTLLSQIPLIIETLMKMVTQVISALAQMLPTLIPVIIDTVVMVVETLIDNIDMLIDAGIQLLLALADGLIEALPKLLEKLPVIIDKVVNALTNNLPKLVQAGIELTVKLAVGMIQAIPQLLEKIPEIIASIVTGFADYYSEMGEIGKNLIKGLWEGIKNMGKWIMDKIAGFGENILSGIKDFFGIASPSKVMANVVGKNLALGIGEGFEDNINGVNDEITGAMDITTSPNGQKRAGGVVVYQTNNYSQAHSRYEIYKSKQQTASAVHLALQGV